VLLPFGDPALTIRRLIHRKRVSQRSLDAIDEVKPALWGDLARFLIESPGHRTQEMARGVRDFLDGKKGQRGQADAAVVRDALYAGWQDHEDPGDEPEGGFVGFVGDPDGEIPKFEGDPRPLAADLLPVPRLPAELIPAAFRDWLADAARRGNYPLEYVAAPALVAVSSLIGWSLAIRPKRQDNWTVVPNLWGAIVGPPGEKKTPATQEALLPLKRLEAEAREEYG
jgi:hypothetical protein